MKTCFNLLVLCSLVSCADRPVIDTPEVAYSDQWLQLDEYFADSCFVLDSQTHTVWVFDDGEEEQTHKDDWAWEFQEPDLYVFNDAINLYSVPANDDCWEMNIWEVDVRACPCRLDIPDRPEIEQMTKTIKEVEFIEWNGKFYVQRPTSWNSGLARYKWFRTLAKIETSIASPGLWDMLSKANKIKVLVEYDNKTWEVK